MPIEFRCTQCDKLLSTETGTSGQKAKCPECGTILLIPAVSSTAASDEVKQFDAPPPREPDFASSAETPPPGDPAFAETQAHPQHAANPYRSPSADAIDTDYTNDATPRRTFQPTRIDMGDLLAKTWRIFTANLGVLIIASLLAHVFSTAASGAVWAIGEAIVHNGGVLAFPVVLLQVGAAVAVSSFFLIGLMKFMLSVARGERVDFSELFSAGPLVLPGLGVLALLIAGTVAGAVFCLIPGLIFLLIYSQSLFMLVDQHTGIVDSFRYSASAMKGNVLTLFVTIVLASIASSLFVMLTCGIGALFATPYLSLLYAVIYLSATGQRTAEDPAAQHDTERPFGSSPMQPT